jgi:hypothetical protein
MPTRRPSGGQRTNAARQERHRQARVQSGKRRYEATIDRGLADYADADAARRGQSRAAWLEETIRAHQETAMSTPTTINLNLDGTGEREYQVYALPPAPPEPVYGASGAVVGHSPTYWPAVTDVPCPVCHQGTLRWAEAGYAPGYRICDNPECHEHFLARGDAAAPAVARMGRTGWPY